MHIPEIGQWYERMDRGEIFQVTGLDEGSKTIEIQAFDGNVDEIDADTWATLPLELAEPPEDWSEPIEEMEAEDLASAQAETTLENPIALERLA
jgi:Family of unknown function (DUF6763)